MDLSSIKGKLIEVIIDYIIKTDRTGELYSSSLIENLIEEIS
jgi:hypothetical protein